MKEEFPEFHGVYHHQEKNTKKFNRSIKIAIFFFIFALIFAIYSTFIIW